VSDLFDSAETAEEMTHGRVRSKKQRPVSKAVAKAITSLKEALNKEVGSDFVLHVEAQGVRVADYSMVFGWLPPKEEK
jgi:hypothetical protein